MIAIFVQEELFWLRVREKSRKNELYKSLDAKTISQSHG